MCVCVCVERFLNMYNGVQKSQTTSQDTSILLVSNVIQFFFFISNDQLNDLSEKLNL